MRKARTIGKLARELGISVETVRFYERKGLITQPPKSEGPRNYDDQTLAMLRYLRLAQQLGFSLKEIHALQGRLADGQAFCKLSIFTETGPAFCVEKGPPRCP